MTTTTPPKKLTYRKREAVALLREARAKKNPGLDAKEKEEAARVLLLAVLDAVRVAEYSVAERSNGWAIQDKDTAPFYVLLKATSDGIRIMVGTTGDDPGRARDFARSAIEYDYFRERWVGTEPDPHATKDRPNRKRSAVAAVIERVLQGLQ